MSVKSPISRRRFLRTLALGACLMPFSRSLGRMSNVLGLHPETPLVDLPKVPLIPPQVMLPPFHSAIIGTPHLALTFDDGPHPKLTPRLLDLLADREVKATFFVIGEKVEAHPDIARRIVEEGHEIANHTWTHPVLSKISAARVTEELRLTHEKVLHVTGSTMTALRPPYGAFNGEVRKIAFDRHAYDTIMWSVDPLDWKYRNSARVRRELLKGAAPGAVLLSHDIHATTVAAMPETIDLLQTRGFHLTTVQALQAMDKSGRLDSNQRPPAPKAGALPS